MPKLNFYNADEVKSFVFDTLIENQELRKEADDLRRRGDSWYVHYQAQKDRADKSSAAATAAISVLDVCQSALQDEKATPPDVNKVIADVIAILKGGSAQ